MTYAKLALKFAPYIAIALLIGAVLWLRGDKIKAEGAREKAETQVAALNDANASLYNSLKIVEAQRADNDKIAEEVAAKLAGNNVREVHTREVIKEAIRNDPQVRAWAEEFIPTSVRDGLKDGGKAGGGSKLVPSALPNGN